MQKSLNEKHIAIYLNHREYSRIYSSLKFKNTCQMLDDKGRVNLFVRIDDAYQLEDAVKYTALLDAPGEYYSPWFVLNLIGFRDIYTLAFRLDSFEDIGLIRRLLEVKSALVHYCLYNDDEIVKLHTYNICIEENISEKIEYMLELNIKGCYPRIYTVGETGEKSYFITVDNNSGILEELLIIADKMKRMNLQDVFDVYIEGYDRPNIIFSGSVQSADYIKNEIQRNFNILFEGKKEVAGIPFFKYKRGFLYFFGIKENDSL